MMPAKSSNNKPRLHKNSTSWEPETGDESLEGVREVKEKHEVKSAGEEFHQHEDVFNARWDRTAELLSDKENKWKRRLDSIARLLEGGSICAAIAIKDNFFLIATNKNFPPNSGDQGYILINTVMSFLREFAKNNLLIGTEEYDKAFKGTFKKICTESMSGLQLSAYIKDELEKDDFIDRVIRASEKGQEDFRELRDYLSEHAEYGHSPASHGSAFVVCVALMKDFMKVIKFINKNRDKHSHIQTKTFIEAIKGYQVENIVDRDKLTPKVPDQDIREKMHAEMRILALLEDKFKNKSFLYQNYIGISKLCCLDCHAMIYAVNNANGYQNSIEIRGAHNVEHAGAWNAPFGITGNPSSHLNAPKISKSARTGTRGNSSEEPFAAAVITEFEKARLRGGVTKKRTGEKVSGVVDVSEYPDNSEGSSGDEGDHYYAKYCSYLLSMEKTLRMRQEVCPKTDSKEELEIIEIGLKIYKMRAFKLACELDFSKLTGEVQSSQIDDFRTFLPGLSEKEQKFLVLFLKNSLYAGEKVSKYFSEIDLNSVLKPEIRKKRVNSVLTSQTRE